MPPDPPDGPGGVDRPTRLHVRGSPAERAADPAEVVVAWEAVEELLAAVPDGPVKQVLRLTAAGLGDPEIAARVGVPPAEVAVLRARGRIRVLTAGLRGD